MSDCLLRGRSARGHGQSAIYLKTVCPVLSGYSGQSSGYSGPGFFYFILFCPLGPTTIKNHLTHSLSTHSLSPVTLSPSHSLEVPSLSPNPRTQNPLPNQSQDQEGFKSVWRTIFPAYSSPGCLHFQIIRAGTARSRYANL